MTPEDRKDLEEDTALFHDAGDKEGHLLLPIDLNINFIKMIHVDNLQWINFEIIPDKMKLMNTGGTALLSAKWETQRPYLSWGPLEGNYVFSQVHFHWGSNEQEGSEHTINGEGFPMEIHTVFYKARYISQQAALKKADGILQVVYMVQLDGKSSAGIQWVASHLPTVAQPATSTSLPPTPLSALLLPFSQDFLAYWGSLATKRCQHKTLTIISRHVLTVCVQDLNMFRTLLNSKYEPMDMNFQRPTSPVRRTLFLINPTSSDHATKTVLHTDFLPAPAEHVFHQNITVNYTQIPELNHFQAQKIFSIGDGADGMKKEPRKLLSSTNIISDIIPRTLVKDVCMHEASYVETINTPLKSKELKKTKNYLTSRLPVLVSGKVQRANLVSSLKPLFSDNKS